MIGKILRKTLLIALIVFLALAIVIPFVLSLLGIHLIGGGGGRTNEGSGLLRSLDKGKTWSNAAISEEQKTRFPAKILDIAGHPRNPDILYLGATEQGLWRSETAGASWKRISDSSGVLQDQSDVYRIGVSASRPETLYVAAFQDNRGRVLVSDNNGAAFRQVYEVSQNRFGVFDLWVDPADARRVLIATGEGGLLETRNGGESWRSVRWFGESLRRLIVNPVVTGEIYILADAGRVWKTSDSGENWRDLSGAISRPDQPEQTLEALVFPPPDLLPSFELGGGSATTLLLDPILPQRLYAISRGELLRSENGGESWGRVSVVTGPAGEEIRSVAVNPSDATLFAGIGSRLLASGDGGVRWSISEFPNKAAPSQLVINPLKPEIMFAIGE